MSNTTSRSPAPSPGPGSRVPRRPAPSHPRFANACSPFAGIRPTTATSVGPAGTLGSVVPPSMPGAIGTSSGAPVVCGIAPTGPIAVLAPPGRSSSLRRCSPVGRRILGGAKARCRSCWHVMASTSRSPWWGGFCGSSGGVATCGRPRAHGGLVVARPPVPTPCASPRTMPSCCPVIWSRRVPACG